MKEGTVYTDFGELYYRVEGVGKPVVLLHGFAEDGTVWKYQLEFLKKYFMLLIPDIPGSGKSILKAGTSPNIDDFAICLKQMLVAECIESCTLIGHSMGGYVTIAFAEKYPQLLNGFGLFHSTAFADTEEKKETRQRGIDFIKKHGALSFLQEAIPNLFADKFKEDGATEIGSLLQAANAFSNESLIVYYRAMMQRPDRKHVIQTFLKPILFIMGEKDKTVNLQDILTQSHQPWQSHVYILKNAAHMGMWEEKEKSNSILLSYLWHVNENCSE